MTTDVHNHRSRIPAGTYLATKTNALRLGRPRPVRSVVAIEASEGKVVIGNPARMRSTVNGVDGLPDGFGYTATWVGDDDLALVGFVSSSDSYGFAVAGVTDGDTFELVDASGHATFSQGTHNDGIAGIVTIVAEAANITVGSLGHPELGPLISNAGATIAKAFPESTHASMPRDAYGQIVGRSEYARQEGGILVCAPDAQGPYDSGNSDNQDRWIPKPGQHGRRDDLLPKHVKHAFFLQRDRKVRVLDGNGELILAPWDHEFADNIGAYRVAFILRRANRSDEPIE